MALFKSKKEEAPEIIEEEMNLMDQMALEEDVKEEIEEDEFERSHSQNVPSEVSVLHADVVIEGNIKSLSNLSVFGKVKGDIDCQYNLKIESCVKGEVKGGNIDLKSAQIEGNIICQHDLRIDNDTVIKGHIVAENCILDGEVTGNVAVSGSLHIQKNAVVHGDLSAKTISVLQGAKISGAVTMEEKSSQEDE